MDKQGGVAEIVYDICRGLVESPSTPAYSEVHESLAPVVSSADSRELLDWMVNNSRARVTLDESDESLVSLESLNLAGYSIDSVDKRLGAALALRGQCGGTAFGRFAVPRTSRDLRRPWGSSSRHCGTS